MMRAPGLGRAHNSAEIGMAGRRSSPRVRVSAAAILALGCGGVVTPTGGDDDGGVPVTPLTVELSLGSAEADVAGLLGWTDGRVPGAEVRVERENVDGSIDDPLIEVTDANGRAVFASIYGGTHRVSALKVLTAQELSLVGQSRPLLRAFGTGGKSVGSTQQTLELTVQPNRADRVVISESSTVVDADTDARWFGYVELYNNSPDVHYLDGMLIGRAPEWHHEWAARDCDGHAQYSNDPEGIWARGFQRVPGSGTQFPVQPGETVLVALDALDHSQSEPWLFDLSNADFEFRSQSDADNSSVPDLIDAGPRAATEGGIQFLPGWHPVWLSGPVDVSGLPQARAIQPVVDDIFVRIPTSAVLSVLDPINGETNSPRAICPMSMYSGFSMLPYVWKRVPDAHLLSQQRRSVGTAPGGWTILLDTGTSAVDWFEADRTPDDLP